MNRYRLMYRKKEEARYISHLDFVRTITRTLRRANLPVKYSQGFNPHMIMTVALPISVGVLSNCEYMDIEFDAPADCEEIKSAINGCIPPGLEIVKVERIDENSIPLNKIMYAKYRVSVEHTGECDVESILKNDKLEVDKKTKKGITLTDIKPMISSLCLISENGGNAEYEMVLAAGNIRNLKPETVISAFCKYSDNYDVKFISIVREAMYFDGLVPVM